MKLSLKKSTFTLILIVIALIVYSIESALPPLVPGIAGARLGLSNVFVLYSLYALGWQSALWVVIARSILGPLITGAPISMFFSISGSLFSLFTMIVIKKAGRDKIGLVGVSVCGSLMHSFGQMLMAYLFTKTALILTYFPVMAAISVPCGIITGVAAGWVLKITRSVQLKNKSKKHKNKVQPERII